MHEIAAMRLKRLLANRNCQFSLQHVEGFILSRMHMWTWAITWSNENFESRMTTVCFLTRDEEINKSPNTR